MLVDCARHHSEGPIARASEFFNYLTEIDVTLGPLLTALRRQECPMAFIAVRCPHCHSDQIVTRGKTGCGTQRYLGQNVTCATGSFRWCPSIAWMKGLQRDTGRLLIESVGERQIALR